MLAEVLAAFRRHPRDAAIAALAWPALGTLAIDPLVTIVDTAWVGRIGTEALAALAIAGAVFAAVFSVFNFIQMTVTPLIAAEVGRDARGRAGAIALGALVVSGIIGVVLAVICVTFASDIAGLFGSSAEVTAEASTYLQIRFLALPVMLIATAGHGIYRGYHDTKTPLMVAIGMNAINLVLDPVLIFGAGLGIAGAAWATVIAQSIAAIWFLYLLLVRQRSALGIGLGGVRVGRLPVGEVLSKGWPMMIRSVALLTAITATTYFAAGLGAVDTAAHQVALQIWLFLAFVLDSFAVAAMAMVGSDLGADRPVEARSLANRLLALGLVTGIGLSVLVFVSAPLVPVLFGTEPEVTDAIRLIYPFVIILQPLTALVYVWDGVGIGAAVFGYLSASMVLSAVVTVGTLLVIGDSLTGIWIALAVLTLTRLVTLAGWHQFGVLASGRGPSPLSRAV